MRRISKAALGGIAGGALILAATQTATGLAPILNFLYSDEVVDLPAEGAFDAASANLTVKVAPDGTNFRLDVTGIDPSAADDVSGVGAHLHTGECKKQDGALAGPHYNHEVVALGVPAREAEISPETEVWFHLVPSTHGEATDSTFVPFLPVDPDGVMSIVVHVAATNPETGAAGARQVCFPLDVSDWAPTAP
jgi:Cu-Zn family superoxide dismutase